MTGRGVFLIDGRGAAASRILQSIVKIAVPAGAFDEIQDAVRYRVARAIELPVDLDLGNARRWGVGHVRQSAERKRSLIVVLVTVEDHVHAMVFEKLRDSAHLEITNGRIT